MEKTNEKSLHLYLVGYDKKDIRTVWGKDNNGCAQWATPMTFQKAEWKRRKMPSKNAIIYKLIPLLKQ